VLGGVVAVPGVARAAQVTLYRGLPTSAVPSTGVSLHTSVYANQWKNSALPGKLVASGLQMLRYPGGSYADGYHFTSAAASGGYIASGSDFGNFASILSSTGAKGMVTVNYGSSIGNTVGGSPQEAAAWVAYANATSSNRTSLGTDATGRNWFTASYWASLRAAKPLPVDDGLNFLRINKATPIGVPYWEVGNEIFGNGYYSTNLAWENDKHSSATGAARVGDANLSPTAYGTNFLQFASLMKAVDPTIKVGAVLTGPGDTGDTRDGSGNPAANNWNKNVLTAAGSAIDFGIIHYYPSNTNTNPNQLISNPRTAVPNTVSYVRQQIQTYGGRDPSTVELHMTEFGNFGDTPTDPVRTSYVAQVYAAALSGGYSSAAYLEMSQYGFLSDTSALTTGGAYYGMQAISPLVNDKGNFVSTASDVSSLVTYAVVQQDGQLAVSLLNQSQTTAETVTVSVPGPAMTYSGTLYAGTGTGMSTQAVSNLPNTGFSVSVPANGVYTYVLTPASSVVPEPVGSASLLVVAGGWMLGRRRAGTGR
jgi:alpha-L-arabinofuranosidase